MTFPGIELVISHKHDSAILLCTYCDLSRHHDGIVWDDNKITRIWFDEMLDAAKAHARECPAKEAT